MNPPDWHAAEADRLLASINDDQLHLPFAANRIAKAQAHALLSLRPVDDGLDHHFELLHARCRQETTVEPRSEYL